MGVQVDPIVSRWQPKPGGGSRRMAVLSRRDADAWRRVAGRVAEVLEPRLGPRVVANRVVGVGGRWELAAVGPAIRRARAAAVQLSCRSGTLVHTDVSAFYPSIDPSVLYRCLRMAGVDPGLAASASDALEGWGSEGYAGLPIGPPGSAVLANAVLRLVDEGLGDLPFLRWVDDYVVAVPSGRTAEQALELFDDHLARLELRRSDRKTAVFDGQRRPWLGERISGLR